MEVKKLKSFSGVLFMLEDLNQPLLRSFKEDIQGKLANA